MPNIKSAMKRVSVTAKKTKANKVQKSAIRSTIRKAKAAVAEGNSDSAVIVNQAIVKMDKAVSKGYIHKNTAARKKSRLTKAVNSMK